jgi:hypothetical protein
MQVFGRLGEAQRFGNGDEVPQVAQLHSRPNRVSQSNLAIPLIIKIASLHLLKIATTYGNALCG